jgi:hypothetical protein
MRAALTSSLADRGRQKWPKSSLGWAAFLALLLWPGLGWAQQEDEESTTIRRVEPGEPTTASPARDPDEETTLVGKGQSQVEARVPVTPARRPVTAEKLITGKFTGYWDGKLGFDIRHEGNREDVFDLRNKFGLAAEVNTSFMTKVYIAGRFSHYTVGENAGDETWYLFNSNDVQYEYEFELREAFIYIPNKVLNIRFGNQVVRWGYGLFNKPSDVLNPVDYREGLFNDLEAPLVPSFMLHLDRTIGPANLSFVWIPFFKGNRMNMFGQDWAPLSAMYGNPAFSSLGLMTKMYEMIDSLVNPLIEDDIQPIMLATNPPADRFENGQWGAKTEFSMGPVDFQLSYLYGWDKLPWININGEFLGNLMVLSSFAQEYPGALSVLQGMATLDPDNPLETGLALMQKFEDMSPEEKEAFQGAMQAVNAMLFDQDGNLRELSIDSIFSTSYLRQHTIGMSLATVLGGRVGLKLDGAYSPERTVFLETEAGFPMPARKPTWSLSLGLEYVQSTRFDIMVELYHFHVCDLAEGEEVFVIGSDLSMFTLAAHLRLLDFDALELQFAGMIELFTLNLFLFPKISYKVNDKFKIAVGGIFAEVLGDAGDEQGPAGLFDRNDMVYLELRYSF